MADVRAGVRIGELSAELEKAQAHGGKICLPSAGKSKHQALKGGGSKGSKRDPLPGAPPTLEAAGIDKHLADRARD